MEAISRAGSVEADCCRYQIFGTLPNTAADDGDDASVAESLEATRVACMSHLEGYVEGYIWQRDPFQLEVVSATGTHSTNSTPAHLSGTTRFGDNVEDEWFVVWMLLELTKQFPSLCARIWDDDGEFLLIECAFHLPKWVKPEAVANRVWLKSGGMHIVPPTADADVGDWARPKGATNTNTPASTSDKKKIKTKNKNDTLPLLTVEAALWLVRGGDGSADFSSNSERQTKASDAVQNALHERLSKYPAYAMESMHKAIAVLPVRLACLLQTEPQLIANAVEAFYLRDPLALNAAASHNYFPLTNMTTALVTTTRCLYAQLDRQRFEGSKKWSARVETSEFKGSKGSVKQKNDAQTLGAKVTAGFEILAATWAKDLGVDLRENSSMSKQTQTQKETKKASSSSDPTRVAFFNSLTRNGYFKGEIEGSAEWKRLNAFAVAQYENANWSEKSRVACAVPAERAAAVLREIDASMPTVSSSDAGGSSPSPLLPAKFEDADSDAWMNSYGGDKDDPLEVELKRRELERERFQSEKSGASPSGTSNTVDNLTDDDPLAAAMSAKLRQFMGDMSGHEGVEDSLLKESDVNRNETNDGDDGDNPSNPENGETLLDARAFLAELSSALGIKDDTDNKNKNNRGFLEGTYTDSDDDFSDDPATDSDEDDEDENSGSNNSNNHEEHLVREPRNPEGNYVYENDEGGEWGGAEFTQEYERAMRKQLEGTNVASSFGKRDAQEVNAKKATNADAPTILPKGFEGPSVHGRLGGASDDTASGETSDSDSDDSSGNQSDGSALDVDLETVSNMLKSFRAQGGAAGPASQLLGSMGVHEVGFGNLHSDDEEEEGDFRGAESGSVDR